MPQQRFCLIISNKIEADKRISLAKWGWNKNLWYKFNNTILQYNNNNDNDNDNDNDNNNNKNNNNNNNK